MPKAKLKISANEQGKLVNAAEFADVKLLEGKQVGNQVLAVVSFRQTSQLFDMGRYFDSMPNEVKENVAPATANATGKKGGAK